LRDGRHLGLLNPNDVRQRRRLVANGRNERFHLGGNALSLNEYRFIVVAAPSGHGEPGGGASHMRPESHALDHTAQHEPPPDNVLIRGAHPSH
jgi:hypothetical protein